LEVIGVVGGGLALIWAQSRHSRRAPPLVNLHYTPRSDGSVLVLVCRLTAVQERPQPYQRAYTISKTINHAHDRVPGSGCLFLG
jgi:hypothetical protein